jgi:hypothetical protein
MAGYFLLTAEIAQFAEKKKRKISAPVLCVLHRVLSVLCGENI